MGSSKEAKRRYRKSEGGKRAWRGQKLRAKYGIGLAEYETLLQAQNGKCAICGCVNQREGYSLAVDHCHLTGRIRGLLCNNCNRGIGLLNDSVVQLQKAIDYLST